jgi:hypothetical protein
LVLASTVSPSYNHSIRSTETDVDERERARKASRAIGNALLIAAGVLFALGALAIGIILEDLDENFGVGAFEGPSFVDYL